MARWIMHLDMDAFFAAIEQRDNPDLRGKPVIVGAMPGGRGVVSTCSYEARKFGVHSAQPIAQAYKRCPQGVYLKPDFYRYRDASQQVMATLRELSPVVEPLGVDEAFVDITGLERLFGSPAQIGRRAKAMICERLQLTASVGIGPNRLIAKLASDFDKPDGLTIVPPDDVLDWLAPQSVKILRGVGPRLVKRLEKAGVRTVAQLRKWSPEALEARFGEGAAGLLYDQARGVASDRIGGEGARKSISKEVTFGVDESDPQVLRDVLVQLAADVGRTARREGLCGFTVTLKYRFPSFETHTRQVRLDHATCSDRTIFRWARALFERDKLVGRAVRLIGLGLTDWEVEYGQQLDLAIVDESRERELYAAVDAITERFGRGAIGPAVGRSRPKPSDTKDDETS